MPNSVGSKQLAASVVGWTLVGAFCIGLSHQETARRTGLTGLLHADNLQLVATARFLSGQDFDYEVSLTEHYSNELKRARLGFRTVYSRNWSGAPNYSPASTYFYSEKANKLLKTTAAQPANCTLESEQSFIRDLMGPMISGDSASLEKWPLLFANDVPRHIIGMAKLLYVVERNKNKLEPSMREFGSTIRNQAVNVWGLTLPMWKDSSEKARMLIYALKEATDGSLGVPMRIWLQTPGNDELSVDFSNVVPLKDLGGRSPVNEDLASVQHLFSYPIGLGCSRLLTSEPKEQEEEQQQHLKQLANARVVSFEARIEQEKLSDMRGQENKPSRVFVAYDGLAHAVRWDFMNEVGSAYAITIEDLLAKQVYRIEPNELDVDRRHEPQARVAEADPTRAAALYQKLVVSDKQCYAAASCNSGRSYEPVLALESMAEMGVTYVRGTRALIYEQVAAELPRLIFPPICYLEAEGARRSSRQPGWQGYFTLVYFLASEPLQSKAAPGGSLEAPGALLRLDVFEGSKFVHKVDFYNFQWQLASAPNGDHQGELFSLQDRCKWWEQKVAPSDTAVAPVRRANNLLLLELVPEIVRRRDSLAHEQLLVLVESASVRQRALVRALASLATSIYASQIVGIKSRVVRSSTAKPGADSMKLVASVELAHSSGPAWPQLEAVAAFRGYAGAGTASTQATSFHECFWHAARLHARQFPPERARQTSAEVQLFGFCERECYIDTDATKDPKSSDHQPYKSGYFHQRGAQGEECEIFEMRYSQAADTGEVEIKSWSQVHLALDRALLELQLLDPHPSGPIGQRAIPFRVKRAELSSLSDMAHIEEARETSHEPGQLDGIALVADQGAIGSEQVNSSRLLADKSASSMSLAVTADACRAICMTSMRCQSYSTCVAGDQQSDCVISRLDLNNGQLLESLAREAAKLRLASGGKAARDTIRVQWVEDTSRQGDEADEQREAQGARGNSSELEFRIDKRCRSRAKRAIEMFAHEPLRTTTKLHERAIAAADDVNTCAELCLKRNVMFFRRAERLMGDASLSPGQLRSALTKIMGFWCATFKFAEIEARSLPGDLQQLIGRSRSLAKAKGLCSMSKPKWASNSSDSTENRGNSPPPTISSLSMDTFEFVYTNLYQRQYSVRPMGSQSANVQSFSMLSHVDDCARTCFSQSKQACRSFDVVHFKTHSFCIYNELTLEEARKQPDWQDMGAVLGPEEPEFTSVWHYELQPAYNFYTASRWASPEPAASVTPAPHQLAVWSIMLVCLLGLSTGLVVALYAARWRYSSQQLAGRPARARLSLGDAGLIQNEQLDLEQQRERMNEQL